MGIERGSNSVLAFWIISLFYLVLFWLTKEFPFFWDNIFLSSKTAHHFFNNGLTSFILPAEWDGGHPPFWGTFIATGWKILGRELWVGHLLMLPILIGLGYQIYLLSEWLLGEKYIWLGLLLGILEPTVIAQSTMVGPEIVLLFAFLLGLNAILREKYLWLFPATCILILVNARGIILCAVLFIILLIVLRHYGKKFKFRYLENFISAALIYVIWLYYHWDQTGHLLAHPDSAWSGHRGIASVKGIFIKIFYFIWWMLDFGRVIIWLVGGYAIFSFIRSKRRLNHKQWVILKIILVCIMSYGLFLCLVSNPILHRYLMLLYILVSLFFASFIIELKSSTIKYLSIVLLAISLFIGHFIIYPNRLATGWDSSLKHISYFIAHKDMMNYIELENIDHSDIATGFPAQDGRYYSELTKVYRPFSSVYQPTQYLLYSNVLNDLKTRKLLDEMESMAVVKRFERNGIFIELLER